MKKKSILISIISVILFSLLFGYTLVYAWLWMFNSSTKIVFKLSNNIFLDSLSLNRTQIMFKSWMDLSNYKIKSECDIYSNIKYHKWDRYLFEIKFFRNKCENNDLVLVNENNQIVKHFNFNVVSEYKALSSLLDVKTSNLLIFQNTLKKKVSIYSKYDKYNKNIEKNYYTFLKKNRILNESIYNFKLISNIILKRSEKYKIPIAGHKLPTVAVKMPNSGRWYRKGYTDWVHHGWDIDANFWDQIVSMDDWIIVRVVSNFKFSDLNYIVKWDNISNYDKVKNLDKLRWNQVWLKTMKWDVIFYSHLNEIFTNIKVWEVVQKWQPIWTVWISWVPDKNYNDYHLHFPIQVNPFNPDMIGKYDLDDYMNWDWMFKGKSHEYLLKHQDSLFED